MYSSFQHFKSFNKLLQEKKKQWKKSLLSCISFQTLLIHPLNSTGSTFKICLKINHFYLPPLLRTIILSHSNLTAFQLVCLLSLLLCVLLVSHQAVRVIFRKVNHVNSMMSFFCLEPLGCPPHLLCKPNSVSGYEARMNQPPDSSASSSPTSSFTHWAPITLSLCCSLPPLTSPYLDPLHFMFSSAWLLLVSLDEHGLVSPVICELHAHVIQYLSPISPDSYPHHLVYVMCS